MKLELTIAQVQTALAEIIHARTHHEQALRQYARSPGGVAAHIRDIRACRELEVILSAALKITRPIREQV